MSIYLLQVACTLALVYALYYWSLRRMTHHAWTRRFLLFGLATAWLLPPVSMWLARAEPVVGVQQMLPVFYSPTSIDLSTLVLDQTPVWTWTDWAWAAYGLISLLVFIRLLIGLSRIFRLYHQGEKKQHRHFTMVINPAVRAPFSFFGAVYVAPRMLEDRTNTFDRMLQHELAHVQGWHSLDVLLVELSKVILWWHPVIPAYRRALRQSHEYLADAAVLSQDTDTKGYARQLLSNLNNPGRRLEDELAHQFYHTFISKRLQMMNQLPSHPLLRWKYALLIPVLLTAVVLFAGSSNASPEYQGPFAAEETVVNGLETTGDPDQMPLFPGAEGDTDEALRANSEQKMLEYVYTRIKYPAVARQAGVQGMAVVSFVIAEDGSIHDLKIARDPGAGLGAAAMAVFEEFKASELRWTPAQENGQAVSYQYHFPVKFKLEGDTPQVAEGAVTEEAAEGDHVTVVGHQAAASVPYTGPEGSDIFRVVEEMPRFPGCEDLPMAERKECAQMKMLEYIYSNVKYPESARTQRKEGMSVVRFVVETDGSLSDVTVLRDPGTGLGAEALKVVESMNDNDIRWIPGRQGGQVVRVQYNLPIKFQLQAVAEEEAPTETPAEVEELLEGRAAGVDISGGEPEREIRLGPGPGANMDNVEIYIDDELMPADSQPVEELKPDDIVSIRVFKGAEMEAMRQRPNTTGILRIYTKGYQPEEEIEEERSNIRFEIDGEEGTLEGDEIEFEEIPTAEELLGYMELYIDGVLQENSYGGLSEVNPNDIEEMMIYKDQEEVAAMRQRPNTMGIVMITTKKAEQVVEGELHFEHQETPAPETLDLPKDLQYFIDGVEATQEIYEALPHEEILTINLVREDNLEDGTARDVVYVITKGIDLNEWVPAGEEAFASVALRPDPATHELNLSYDLLSTEASTSTVRVFDMQGRLLHNRNFETSQVQATFKVDVAGVYIINIEKDGQLQAYKVML